MELEVKHQELENCQFQIDIEIPPKELENEYQSVKKNFSKHANIPGFRKGKVPLDIIEKKFKESIKSSVIENILPRAYKQAVDDKKLKPFGKAHVEKIGDYKEDEVLTVQFLADRMPTVNIKKIDDIEITVSEIIITESDVEKESNKVLEKISLTEDTESPIVEGDRIKINVTAVEKIYQKLNLKEHHTVLKQDDSIPYGLFEDLKGMKKGGQKQVEKSFSPDHKDALLMGKKINFQIELLEAKKVILPPLNDESAKQLDFKSVDDMKDSIKNRLEDQVELYKQTKKAESVLSGLKNNSSFEIPDSLVEAMTNDRITKIKSHFLNKEEIFNLYLEESKKTMPELENEFRRQSVQEIKDQLLIQKIQEDHKIEAEEKDIVDEIQKQADKDKRDVKELRKDMIKSGEYTRLKNKIAYNKVIDFIISKGKIKKEKSISFSEFLKQDFTTH